MSEETKLIEPHVEPNPGPNPPTPGNEPINEPFDTDSFINELSSTPKQDYSTGPEPEPDPIPEPGDEPPVNSGLEPSAQTKADNRKAAKSYIESVDIAAGFGLNIFAGDDDFAGYKASPKDRAEATELLAECFDQMEKVPKMPPWIPLLLILPAMYWPKFEQAKRKRKAKQARKVKSKEEVVDQTVDAIYGPAPKRKAAAEPTISEPLAGPRLCAYCEKELESHQPKYCSRTCAGKGYHKERSNGQ